MLNNSNNDKKETEIKPYSKPTRKLTLEYIIGLVISFVVNTLICVGIFCYEYYSQSEFLYTCLVDALSISGLILVLLYILVLFSDKGVFDGLSYSVQLVFNNIFYRNIRNSKLPSSYSEYKLMKRGKAKTNVSYMLFVGLLFLIVGIILLIPFYKLR